MFFIGAAAARRAMRRHQDLAPTPPRLPLWRLLLGELAWATRQLRAEPRVATALALGVAAAIAVLGAAAPGPALPWPARLLVALLAGLVLARGTWMAIRRSRRRRPAAGRGGRARPTPGLAATEVVGAAAAIMLVVWLGTWLVTALG